LFFKGEKLWGAEPAVQFCSKMLARFCRLDMPPLDLFCTILTKQQMLFLIYFGMVVNIWSFGPVSATSLSNTCQWQCEM
jgi:hypothetical protein